MADYASINRYVDRGERWLFIVSIVLTVLLVVSVLMGGLSLRAAPAQEAYQERPAAQQDSQRSLSPGEVAEKTRGRAPFRTGRVVQAREVDELGAFRMVGGSTRKGVKKAYIRDLKLEKLLIKEIGDQLGSYEVVDIDQDGVVLRKGSQDFVLRK